MPFILFLIGLPLLITLVHFTAFLLNGKGIVHEIIMKIVEILSLLVLPYLYIKLATENNCCGESAAFSPEHQLTIFVIASLSLIAYFISSYRKQIFPPILEIIINCFIIVGIVLNIFIAVHSNSWIFAVAGNLPIILLGILVLAKNQKAFIDQSGDLNLDHKSRLVYLASKILHLPALAKFPLLFIVSLPLLFIITSLLLLAGQRPDSLVRAFTETYKHGFSQLDFECENVACGGHYLCSVAANGHSSIVKPQRLGIRNGHYIICNRQLLISNAFEDLIQQRFPILHKIIRTQYNEVGKFIHRYYSIFSFKIVSDIVYILMKPLEWIFLIILYSFDRNPENRIARQYLGASR